MKRFFLLLALSLLAACSGGQVRRYGVEVLRSCPHDRAAYTQGLFFRDSTLFESTGEFGSSSFREVELESGKVLRRFNFDARYFVEGSVMLENRLYILTWTNREAFVYDADSLRYLKTVRYPREGWGLTTDGCSLIASDGSSRLYFMDGDFKRPDRLYGPVACVAPCSGYRRAERNRPRPRRRGLADRQELAPDFPGETQTPINGQRPLSQRALVIS